MRFKFVKRTAQNGHFFEGIFTPYGTNQEGKGGVRVRPYPKNPFGQPRHPPKESNVQSHFGTIRNGGKRSCHKKKRKVRIAKTGRTARSAFLVTRAFARLASESGSFARFFFFFLF